MDTITRAPRRHLRNRYAFLKDSTNGFISQIVCIYSPILYGYGSRNSRASQIYAMRPDIHPEYRQVLFHDTSVDHYFLVGSTVQTEETLEYEGKTYPYVQLELSSASHPFYTGKQRTTDRDGRVAQFNKRFKSRPL